MSFTNQLFRNPKKEKFNHHLETIFGGVDSADIQSLSKCNKGIKYLLCAIKKGLSIVYAFQKLILEGRNVNKIWVDQGS